MSKVGFVTLLYSSTFICDICINFVLVCIDYISHYLVSSNVKNLIVQPGSPLCCAKHDLRTQLIIRFIFTANGHKNHINITSAPAKTSRNSLRHSVRCHHSWYLRCCHTGIFRRAQRPPLLKIRSACFRI